MISRKEEPENVRRPDCEPPPLANIELEGLESTTYRGAARTLSSGALLGHENLDTLLTDATDALRTGVRVS